MKKVVSTAEGVEIKFRANGNPGGSGAAFLITNEGVIVADNYADLMEERLGGQVSIQEATTEEVETSQNDNAPAPEEGSACELDGKPGTYQRNEDDKLVCVVTED